ncbi:23S rRNA (uracil(747)-C(5))-methyltransferase RlmC [Herbiconiux sp. L3-i23]|uniref:23S rRNA (uracil(747)-C(5))-methyltransferase RlmC n=1 Tax=Herbiconiux sp. L3-i23 TaxID=2905871 RepID=UPI00206035EC|nr:23S rRNA (uracil(747)-C(5))-methyltransferase RlmC [Herbiconiux sp. L3-i23]BDI23395.1 23S rRNA (uracil(747)-C(5))-methyltransferase RlmC [Herbiconiux sp. L3-i23]
MQCSYYDAGLCRSCTLLEQPYPDQLADKDARSRSLLDDPTIAWLPPVASAPSGYRNKAKMVVGGTVDAPTLGILDGRGRGVDLRGCALCTPGIQAAMPALAAFVTLAGLAPYDVPARSGELKYVLVTEAPNGELMLRFVLRSEASIPVIRANLDALHRALPRVAVVTANLLPEHKAVVEGDREVVLTTRDTLTMTLGGIDLHLRPQSFFQTNTDIAERLYAQAREWADEIGPRSVWDLYCGVGGFALHLAAPGRSVIGVEASVEAIESARRSAGDLGLTEVRFESGDATRFAMSAGDAPDLVVVNPPRRGIGAELAGHFERSGPRHIVYSSCNPVSLAKDLAMMPSYAVRRARVLDMFPQTLHLEVITLLERR